MVRRSAIDSVAGTAAVRAWLADPDAATRTTLATATRYTAQLLAEKSPGKAVEVRVPPFVAVQCADGGTHRRGTPRAVVETTPQVWLRLATGQTSWSAQCAAGHVSASGERSDIGQYLPVLNVHNE